jgi:hypothetical protein
MPLVLHLIDVKLSFQNRGNRMTPDEKRRTALKQHRLNILIEAMKTYQPQYDGVDYISETTRHIINLAQIDPPSNPANTTTTTSISSQESIYSMKPIISDWTDILASQPGLYLRLSMTMDISISKGRLAQEADFPVKLRGLFAKGFSPIRALLAAAHTRTPPPVSAFPTASRTPVLFVASPYSHMQLGTVHSMSSDEESGSPDSVEAMDNPRGTLDSNNNSQAQVSGSLSLPPVDSMAPAAGTRDQEVSMQMQTQMGIFGDSGDTDYTLTAEALTAYVLQRDNDGNGNENGAESATSDHSMYDGDGDRDTGKEADWIELAWDDEVKEGQERGADLSDKETALVLLDALGDDATPAPCAV